MEFEEYAAARWPALYRTALLLTGHPAEAGDLAQTTLVKVCAGWAKVRRADSPDAYVRRMLVNELTSDRRRCARRSGLLPDGFDPTRAVWSPSGAIVAAHVAGQAAIVDLDGGSAPVRPPTDVTILQWFGFESDAYVVAAAAVDNVPSLVRCATDRSACAVISRLPADWQSWRWATSPPGGTGQP